MLLRFNLLYLQNDLKFRFHHNSRFSSHYVRMNIHLSLLDHNCDHGIFDIQMIPHSAQSTQIICNDCRNSSAHPWVSRIIIFS